MEFEKIKPCEVSDALNSIHGLRKDARAEQELKATELFYTYLRQNNHEFFERDFLLSFMSDEIALRTKQKIKRSVIKRLESTAHIVKRQRISDCKPFLEQIQSTSQDFESYAFLMAKNGYKTHYGVYEYDEQRQIPVKRVIARRKVGYLDDKENDFDFDYSEAVSNKPRSSQACFTNNSKSYALKTKQRRTKAFFLTNSDERKQILKARK